MGPGKSIRASSFRKERLLLPGVMFNGLTEHLTDVAVVYAVCNNFNTLVLFPGKRAPY